MDGHNKNIDHKAFKEPFPSYDKGESSKSKPNNKVNYTYSNNDNVINMVEPIDVEYCDFIIIKGRKDNAKLKTPFFLRGPALNKSNYELSQSCANTVTCSHANLVLKGLVPSSPELEQHKDKILAGLSDKGEKHTTNVVASNYSILD